MDDYLVVKLTGKKIYTFDSESDSVLWLLKVSKVQSIILSVKVRKYKVLYFFAENIRPQVIPNTLVISLT